MGAPESDVDPEWILYLHLAFAALSSIFPPQKEGSSGEGGAKKRMGLKRTEGHHH
jgi:hypothetical protein